MLVRLFRSFRNRNLFPRIHHFVIELLAIAFTLHTAYLMLRWLVTHLGDGK